MLHVLVNASLAAVPQEAPRLFLGRGRLEVMDNSDQLGVIEDASVFLRDGGDAVIGAERESLDTDYRAGKQIRHGLRARGHVGHPERVACSLEGCLDRRHELGFSRSRET